MGISAHRDRADFHVQRFAEQPFESGRVARRRPELEFRVAGRP